MTVVLCTLTVIINYAVFELNATITPAADITTGTTDASATATTRRVARI